VNAFRLQISVNYDSVQSDKGTKSQMRKQPKEHVKQSIALVLLVVLTVGAIAGPTGLLAWAENSEVLSERQERIAILTEKRDALQNRVELLDPNGADPDLVGELVRKDLGVIHPDEIVITLEDD
jgi:cell division protein FtsB